MEATAQTEKLLRSVYGRGFQQVVSVSLDAKDNVVGVFRGSPRAGQTRYYRYTLSSAPGSPAVRYRRIGNGKMDALRMLRDRLDEGCGCEKCSRKKRKH